MTHTQHFVGIDVSKATLDIAVLPQERAWQIEREDKAISALVEELRRGCRLA